MTVWRALVVILSLLVGGTIARAAPPRHFILELDIAIERGGVTGVLFDFGDGIWGENSSVANVPPGNAPTTVRLTLPTRPIRELRFDPTADDSPVVIAGMRLLSDGGEVLLRIDPRSVRPMHQIQAITPEGTGVRVQPIAKADDPMLRLNFPPLQKRMHDAMGRRTVGPVAVVFLGFVIAAMVLVAAITAWLAVGGRRVWVGSAAVFCTVFGVRLVGLNLCSRSVPFWDEWEGDALYMLIPYVGGFLDWGALFMPQWEHRILLTRLITLGGTVLNGEWDPRVAMTVSAAMFSATIALLGTTLLATRGLAATTAAVVLAVCAALPYDFNNLLWGGQTQMYGLILTAACTLSLASAPRITLSVTLGALAASLVSLVTMGAGPVAPGCAMGICLVRYWFEPQQRRALATLAAVLFFAVIMGVLSHVSSRAHVPFYATTFAQFQRAAIGVFAWPLPPRIIWGALVWLPWVINGIAILRRREATTLEWLAVGLGGWGFVNAIALGYARQYEGPPFDSRFFTPISVGAMGSVCGSVALALRAPAGASRAAIHLGWCTVAVVLASVGIAGVTGARASGATRGEIDHRIRILLTTGNRQPLLEKPPHHTGNDLADRLESPLLQRVLPAPYRRALASRAPDRQGTPQAGPVTVTVRTLMKAGPVIAAIGMVGCAVVWWRARRIRPPGSASDGLRLFPITSDREERVNRAFYIAAIGITVAWVLAYIRAQPGGLVDEPGHVGDIHHFLDRKSGWPESMPMLPGYHFIALSLWKLHPAIATLTMARLTTALITLMGFAAFAVAWRHLHHRSAGRALLLLAVLPLTQPFTGMAYTDMPALAFALGATWAHVTGRRAFAALVMAGAVALRQTNLAWAGFLIAWEFLREDEPKATFVRRVVWQAVVIAAVAVAAISAGRLTVGTQHGNAFTFNIATIHFGGLLVLLLGLPVWLSHLPRALRYVRETVRTRPRRAIVAGTVGLIAAAIFALRFANAHSWNRDLWWEGCSFTLLRNWPLVWIDRHDWAKAVSGVNLVVMMVALGSTIAGQPQRRALWLVLGFGLLPVLTNGLVEPRYFIPVVAFFLLFVEINNANGRRLALWWALLSLLHAPFVAKALSLW